MSYIFTNEWFSPTYHRKIFSNTFKDFSSKPIKFLEIGVHEGRSATWIIDNCLDHDNSLIYLIDPYLIDDVTTPVNMETRQRSIHNLSICKYPNKVKRFEDVSSNVLPHLFENGDRFDAIYIDGSHLGKDVLFDAILSEKLLKNKGILIFDDYGDKSELNKAVDRFLEFYGNSFDILYKGYILVLRKK